MPSVAFELFAPPLPPRGFARLDEEARAGVERASGLRHARHRDCAATLATAAAREAIEAGDAQVGVLCNGGPWNVWASTAMLMRAADAGPAFVNPLLFPATLNSHVATAAAAELGAHAFAFVCGGGRLAFFDMLLLAARLVRCGAASVVLATAVCHGRDPLATVTRRAGLPRPLLDVALCARIGRPSGRGTPCTVTVEPSPASAAPGDEPAHRIARWQGDGISGTHGQLLEAEALSASGAVLIAEAAAAQPPGETVGITASDGRRTLRLSLTCELARPNGH